jgi:hypothetical protein
VAKRNGKTITLTLEKLQAVSGGQPSVGLSPAQLLKRALRGMSLYVTVVFAGLLSPFLVLPTNTPPD